MRLVLDAAATSTCPAGAGRPPLGRSRVAAGPADARRDHRPRPPDGARSPGVRIPNRLARTPTWWRCWPAGTPCGWTSAASRRSRGSGGRSVGQPRRAVRCPGRRVARAHRGQPVLPGRVRATGRRPWRPGRTAGRGERADRRAGCVDPPARTGCPRRPGPRCGLRRILGRQFDLATAGRGQRRRRGRRCWTGWSRLWRRDWSGRTASTGSRFSHALVRDTARSQVSHVPPRPSPCPRGGGSAAPAGPRDRAGPALARCGSRVRGPGLAGRRRCCRGWRAGSTPTTRRQSS